MNNFVILVVDDASVNVKMAERFLKTKEQEIIDIINGTKEYENVVKISIETFSGPSAGKNAVGRINNGSLQIDLVITDLNMEDGYSGCTVIQEIVKRDPKIPVYVVSNSLSEFFRNGESSCETLQNSENGIVSVFKNCCGLPNIIGISKNNTGKLELNEISSLFQKFVVYKKKIRQDGKIDRILGRVSLDAKNEMLFPSLSKAERVLDSSIIADNGVAILPPLSKAERVLGKSSTMYNSVATLPLISKADRVLGRNSNEQSVLIPPRPNTEQVLGRKYIVEEEQSINVPSRPTTSKAERILGISEEQNAVSPLFRRIRNMGATRVGGKRPKCTRNGKNTVRKCRRKCRKYK